MNLSDLRAYAIAFTILSILTGLHIAEGKYKAQDLIEQEQTYVPN